MVNTAVILAGGMGTRLHERTKNKPKGFLEIDNKPIVEESILKLLEIGIEQIVIGTGYLAEVYDHLAMRYPQVLCVRNNDYMKTGSMYTLYNLRERVSDDFLLLESDLIYEKQALEELIKLKESDVILASQFTNSNDEVFIETDENHLLVNLSKNRNDLNHIHAELTGITKISVHTLQILCDFAKSSFSENPQLDYESALAGISKQVNIYVHKLNNFVWCEIDNEQHLLRAVNYIYPMIKLKEKNFPFVKRNILLNPGPATTTDTVKYAQVVPDICPREEEFGDVMQMISTKLTALVANSNNYSTVLFGGSGTAAVESILSSVISEDAVLIINNGAYGKRMCQIADAYKLNYIEFQSSPYEALDLVSLEDIISSSKFSHLCIVHNETTTGLLNDISLVGHLCEKYQIQLIVDAMSSYGAIPIDLDSMNISYLAASSNKNLQGMAGVAFVIARTKDLETTQHLHPRNFYLHLYSQYKYFSKTKQMRFTPPVQTLYALKQAIIETRLEGVEKRYKRYTEAWETLIKGITRLGLKHLVKKENHSRIITAIVEPTIPNYDFEDMHKYFYRNGFTIYPGKLDGQNTFRVANIGAITNMDMNLFIKLLEQYLINIGYCTEGNEMNGISKT
ncbi:2-aminoethylphosphonate--pyruvate transaminase [Neobacillus pocheonensis]|uniref:2-aminoethylphosphonate--pyruvate transaminase n=1 Tax=Neobacillus pocheonensis TaxID=363869 RepID=A0ABT0W8V8_9BACI|nr:2-aminoethylphosphonate--pyruvate transaminase [Neobacillus pocheonensis]